VAGAERRGGAVEDFDVGPLTFADIKELVGVIDPNEWELLMNGNCSKEFVARFGEVRRAYELLEIYAAISTPIAIALSLPPVLLVFSILPLVLQHAN